MWTRELEVVWGRGERLTPRQAYVLISALECWAEFDLTEWLAARDEPLHTVDPFTSLDQRVMMVVNDNTAFAAATAARCIAIAEGLRHGRMPVDRAGCFMDEVLIGAALLEVAETFEDQFADPVLAERLPECEGDQDWDTVRSALNRAARWPEWQIPLTTDHPALPTFLAQHHPYRWFDLPRSSIALPTGGPSERLLAYTEAQGSHVAELRRVTQPDTPWPAADNPMLEYLVEHARELAVNDLPGAITWLAVHAWFEGSLEARSGQP